MATYNPTGSGGTFSGTEQEDIRREGRYLGTDAGEAAERTGKQASEVGKDIGAKLERAGERIGEKVGGVTGSFGNRMVRAADRMQEKRGNGFVADKLQRGGHYLQEHDAKTMARSLDNAICNHPYRTAAVGLGLGWLAGKVLRR